MLPSRTVGSNGGRDPFVERIGRLHVVVAVDQHDRLAGHRRRLGIDERMAGRFDQFGRQAQLLELRRHPLGRPAHVAGVARIGADAGDAQQVGQVVARTPARCDFDVCR